MTIRFPTNICSKPFTIEHLERVRSIIKNNPQLHRNALSELLCKEFNWISKNGKPKKMSCKVAMLKLWRAGIINLPPARHPNVNGKKFKTTSVSDPQFPIEKKITELQAIEIISVKTAKESRLWNELIERYHYLGFKPLPGAQIRYLIYCAEGLLGAIGFSASAWKVAPRDNWIGWDSAQRQKNLHLIVNNKRESC
jgi:hypothetical protein